ncbi:MAG: prepilin-type N-terminal cleavage/methylation domain-containing protein [Planctomycetes bacterium]|jgi:prepilin-type N-terminal cleavage/methylation domain-containing protein|nr:prepilin-type N-terminal cleavage/methylation domain-containing protein [Planctomycetota bacterium]
MHSYTRGFTLLELLIVVSVVGVLSLAAVPLLASNTRDARSSEARAALGVMKDRGRAVYQRNKTVPRNLNALGIKTSELKGTYFSHTNYSCRGSATAWTATCTRVFDDGPTSLTITSNLNSGSARFNR